MSKKKKITVLVTIMTLGVTIGMVSFLALSISSSKINDEKIGKWDIEVEAAKSRYVKGFD